MKRMFLALISAVLIVNFFASGMGTELVYSGEAAGFLSRREGPIFKNETEKSISYHVSLKGGGKIFCQALKRLNPEGSIDAEPSAIQRESINCAASYQLAGATTKWIKDLPDSVFYTLKYLYETQIESEKMNESHCKDDSLDKLPDLASFFCKEAADKVSERLKEPKIRGSKSIICDLIEKKE